ncbi:MAG: nucleotide-binding protein [Prevotellaceae bacterium]|jgi:hypothetical protein|nr:nucleotide-binding protein [Prevotellaceae bacterium]
MAKNLIELFQDFSQSIDIVDDEQLKSIKSIFDKIVESLSIEFYEVQKAVYTDTDAVETFQNANVVLTHYWCKGKSVSEPSVLTKDETGIYKGKGHVAYAFTNNKSLWITNKDGSPLSLKEDYIDSLPGKLRDEVIPKFWNINEQKGVVKEVKTSIIMLLKYIDGNIPIGILNFESSKYIPFDSKKRQLFENIGTAVATIMQLNSIKKIQSANTATISNKLLDIRDLLPLSKLLDKPKVFVAFPKCCDINVISAIKSWSKTHKKTLEFIFWDEMNHTGNIITQIIEQINQCKYGIAYFSEEIKQKNGKIKYIDNSNVLFEAGMFHAMIFDKNDDTLMKEWLPIRENEKLCLSKIPFDLIQERMIIVERTDNGKINEDIFIEELKKKTEIWIYEHK